MEYLQFLQSKIDIAPETGFDVSLSEINPVLKPHARDAVQWAIKGGRRALFESFGLAKTSQQLEFCRLVSKHTGKKSLLTMPLEVRGEFVKDAVDLMGMEAPQYVRTMAEAKAASGAILMTNYERVRDGDIDPTYFGAAASLDEASVLRGYGTKTYQTFLDKFKGVDFKLVATATPAPNKYKELIHYGGYLEVMDTGQALTRFFKRDSSKANNLTLYPGKEEEFWLWVSSWALFINKPSDLGYDDTGYILPPLKVRYHKLTKQKGFAIDRDGQAQLYENAAVGLPAAAKIKRESIAERVSYATKLAQKSPQDHFILWHDYEAERHAIKKALPEAVEIYGSLDPDIRAKQSMDFADGKSRILATKKELSGSGCNFQRHCHRMIFVGIDYEFNDFIQAIHRCYRFLQKEQVEVDILYMEEEAEVLAALKRKWKQHNEMVAKMGEIVRKYGLSGTSRAKKLARSIGVDRKVITGNRFTAIHNDCVIETQEMKENSIDLIHTSIPFSNHYEYTASYNDFGHNQDTEKFFQQMDFLTPELLRILKPGRVAAIHVKDRVLFGNTTGTGMPTMEPFHAMCISHYMRHGFQYFGMITVVTDVVRENNQTYRLGYSEQCKDGTKMGVGCPEYILLFRKLPTDTSRAYADTPVAKSKDEYSLAQWQLDAHAFWRSSGDRRAKREEIAGMSMHYYQKPLLVCYSGGKDSDVLLELAKRAKIPYEVQHSHTTADAPETVRHIRAKFRELELSGVKCTVNKPFYQGKPTSMWDLIPKKLILPTMFRRYCCEVLKEQAGQGRMVVLGVRKAESIKRADREAFETLRTTKAKKKVYSDDNLDTRRLFEHCTVKTQHAVNPIIDWDNRDVWDYLHDCKTVCNPLYCEFSRVGCIGCPMAGKKRYEEFRRWPAYKKMYLSAIARMIKMREEKGLPVFHTTPEEAFAGWMEDRNLDGQINFEGVLEE